MEKQNHEDHLRGRYSNIPYGSIYIVSHYFFFVVVFFAFFAGAFFVAIFSSPPSAGESKLITTAINPSMNAHRLLQIKYAGGFRAPGGPAQGTSIKSYFFLVAFFLVAFFLAAFFFAAISCPHPCGIPYFKTKLPYLETS